MFIGSYMLRLSLQCYYDNKVVNVYRIVHAKIISSVLL